MIGRGTARAMSAALALLLVTGGACGDGGGGIDTENQSVIVVHVKFDPGVPDVHQIRVDAHLANGGIDNSLYFPSDMPRAAPIPSGATLALLIPTTRNGPVDMTLYALDASGQTLLASGKGHTEIAVGARVEITVNLSPCTTTTCN